VSPSWEASVARERDRLDAQHEIDAAEDRVAETEAAFFMAALNHSADCGDPDVPVHDWPSYIAQTNAHRAYEDARLALDQLT